MPSAAAFSGCPQWCCTLSTSMLFAVTCRLIKATADLATLRWELGENVFVGKDGEDLLFSTGTPQRMMFTSIMECCVDNLTARFWTWKKTILCICAYVNRRLCYICSHLSLRAQIQYTQPVPCAFALCFHVWIFVFVKFITALALQLDQISI